MPKDPPISTLSPCSAEAVGAYLLAQKPIGRLLDVGCGHGELLSWLSQHTKYQLCGAEPDVSRCETARSACPTAQIANARMELLPWADNSFDLLYFGCVLSLTIDPEAVWREISRLLASEGCLVIADVYAAEKSCRLDSPMLRRIARREEFECIAAQNGFQCTDFNDRTRSLIQWAVQIMWSGSELSLPGSWTEWRSTKAGYAFWTFRKR